jgi:hypothetical protein
MKKSFIILFFLFSKYSGFSQTKDTITINKIIFNVSGNPGWDNNELLKKNQFTIIFKEGGEVELTSNGTYPYRSKQKGVIYSYFGKIDKSEFEKLSRFLKKINFITLQNEYSDEVWEDGGSRNYTIFYNQSKIKSIRVENIDEIKELRKFSEMIMNFKKQIKWSVN